MLERLLGPPHPQRLARQRKGEGVRDPRGRGTLRLPRPCSTYGTGLAGERRAASTPRARRAQPHGQGTNPMSHLPHPGAGPPAVGAPLHKARWSVCTRPWLRPWCSHCRQAWGGDPPCPGKGGHASTPCAGCVPACGDRGLTSGMAVTRGAERAHPSRRHKAGEPRSGGGSLLVPWSLPVGAGELASSATAPEVACDAKGGGPKFGGEASEPRGTSEGGGHHSRAGAGNATG
jgi:hypothetical protein